MKLIRAYAKNFGPFEEIDLDFDNVSGLSMLDGWNYDDNSASGAGKTFIMDLISFVPFGESPRGLKVNEFINDNSPKGCVGILKFRMDNNSILTIERTRKPEDLHYVIDDGKPVRGGNLLETQRLIEDLLKLDFNTFLNSVYFTQNTKLNFIEAKDTEKRDILTRILDLSDFDKAYDAADLEIKTIEKSLIDIKVEIDKVNTTRNMCVSDLEDLVKNSKAFGANQAGNITYKNQQISAVESKIKDTKMLIEMMQNQKFDVPQFDTPIPDLSQYDREQEELRNTKFEVVNTEVKRQDNSDLTERAADLIKKVSIKAQVELKIKTLEKERTEINFELKTNDKAMAKMLSTGKGTCANCLQEIDEEHIKRHVDELQGTQNELSLKLQTIDLTKWTNALDKVLSYERELSGIEVEKNKREKEYSAKLKEMADKQRKIDEQKLAIERKISSIENMKQILLKEYAMAEKLHTEKIKTVEMEKAASANRITSQMAQIETFEAQVVQLKKDIKDLEDQKNPFIESIEKKEKEIKNSEFSIRGLQMNAAQLEQDIEILTILKASYKNVKYYIFESTIDELNNRIDKYLTPLFNEDIKVRYEYISGKNNDKLKFETRIIKNGVEKSYESLSDGEKCRAKLATNFALSDIVSLRKSNSFSLMLLDEVFNGLPEECRERVVDLLETLKNEKEQILIIDHFKAVGTLVENTIRVEKRDGISRVVNA